MRVLGQILTGVNMLCSRLGQVRGASCGIIGGWTGW